MDFKLLQTKSTKLLCRLLAYVVVFFCVGHSNVQAKEFIIGVEDVSYYPLYDFSAGAPEGKSFTKDLLSTFFRHQGYQFKFVALPLKRFDKWYVEEAIDFKFPDNYRWRAGASKKLDITYSEPVLQLIAGTFVLQKNQNKPRKDIQRLGTILGFFPTLWYDRVENNTLDLIEASSSFSLIKHLLHGNIDAVNVDKNVIDYNLMLLGEENDAVVLNKHIQHDYYAYYFSTIHHPKVIAEFNDFLSSHSQLVKEIKARYNIVETLPIP